MDVTSDTLDAEIPQKSDDLMLPWSLLALNLLTVFSHDQSLGAPTRFALWRLRRCGADLKGHQNLQTEQAEALLLALEQRHE